MKKKRAFTMVELIFVIVILGILAAVAVPRLNASRADAKTAALKANLITLAKDFETYYAANGSYCTPTSSSAACYAINSKITNVPFDRLHQDGDVGYFKIDGKDCIQAGASSLYGYDYWYFIAYAQCKTELEKEAYDDVRWLFTGYTQWERDTTTNTIEVTTPLDVSKEPNFGKTARHIMNESKIEW